MLIQNQVPVAFVQPGDNFSTWSLATSARSGGQGDNFDVLRRFFKNIQIGSAHYHLRSPLLAVFYPRLQGNEGRLMCTPSVIPIVGKGANFDEAWQDWAKQFHVRFQTLLAMRPWEMQPEQLDEWERIEQMVNVEEYRRETPCIIRQIGILTRRRPIPDSIRWEDGRKERVNLEQMPPEFASLHEGERFEAEVMRDAVTGQLIQAVTVRRLPPLPSPSEMDAEWESFPTTNEAEPVDWVEFE